MDCIYGVKKTERLELELKHSIYTNSKVDSCNHCYRRDTQIIIKSLPPRKRKPILSTYCSACDQIISRY